MIPLAVSPFVAALLALAQAAPQTGDDPSTRPERFAADLDLAMKTIRDLHPDPYWKHGPEKWKKRIASLRYRLDALTPAQFEIELARIVALLEDGHSGIYELRPSARLPIEFAFYAEGLFVTKADDAHAKLVGRRVVAIDGRSPEVVLARLRDAVCADNEFDARRRLPAWLRNPRRLHAADTARERAALTLTFAGESDPVRIEARPPAARERRMKTEKPLVRDRERERRWFHEKLFGNTSYVRFRAVTEPKPGAFAEFCRETFAEIERDKEIERLVIDMRGNGGGSNYILQPLIHGVLRSRCNAPGRLFVITDEGTFSAAMNCATRLERETYALFVGQPTGARPNHFGDARNTVLPNTGLRLRCSTMRWWDSDPRDTRRWIQPDIPVTRRIEDERSGRDAALTAIAAWRHRPIEGFDDKQPVAHWFRKTQKNAFPPEPSGAPAPPERTPNAEVPPGRTTYMGRRIAQTMHWLGARWLMRKTRDNEEHTSRLLTSLELTRGLDVCDFGCGNGYHTLEIAERVGTDGRVFAVDIQKQMLSMLKQRQQKRGLENIVRILNGVADTGLEERSCDLILLVDVYHELSHPVITLRGLRRALKPGGRLVLVEFRAEDPDVPIKKLHKMTKAQAVKELAANGFRLHDAYDELPWQHVLTFVPRERK